MPDEGCRMVNLNHVSAARRDVVQLLLSVVVQSEFQLDARKPVANIIVMLDNALKSSVCFNAWCEVLHTLQTLW